MPYPSPPVPQHNTLFKLTHADFLPTRSVQSPLKDQRFVRWHALPTLIMVYAEISPNDASSAGATARPVPPAAAMPYATGSMPV